MSSASRTKCVLVNIKKTKGERRGNAGIPGRRRSHDRRCNPGVLKNASYAADWVKNGQPALSALDCQRQDPVLAAWACAARTARRAGPDARCFGARAAMPRLFQETVWCRSIQPRKRPASMAVLRCSYPTASPRCHKPCCFGREPCFLAANWKIASTAGGRSRKQCCRVSDPCPTSQRRKLGSEVIKNVRRVGWIGIRQHQSDSILILR
jgi:hypothetical protein